MNFYSHCKKLSETNPFNPSGFFGGKPPKSVVDQIIDQNPNIIVDVDLSTLYDDTVQYPVEKSVNLPKSETIDFELLLDSSDLDFDPNLLAFETCDFELLSPIQHQSTLTKSEKRKLIDDALESKYQEEALDEFELELQRQDEEDLQYLALALVHGEAITEIYNQPGLKDKALDLLSPDENNEFFNKMNDLSLSALNPEKAEEIEEVIQLKQFNEENLQITDGKENLIEEFFKPVLQVDENDFIYLISKLNDCEKPFFIKEPTYTPRSPGSSSKSSDDAEYVLNPYYHELMSQGRYQVILKFLRIQLSPSWKLEEKQAAQMNFHLPVKFDRASIFLIHALVNDKRLNLISKYKVPQMNKILQLLESTIDRLFFRFSYGSINIDYSWAPYFQKYQFNVYRKFFKFKESELSMLDRDFRLKFKLLISFYLVTMYSLKGKRLVISKNESMFLKFRLLALDGYILNHQLVTTSLV